MIRVLPVAEKEFDSLAPSTQTLITRHLEQLARDPKSMLDHGVRHLRNYGRIAANSRGATMYIKAARAEVIFLKRDRDVFTITGFARRGDKRYWRTE